MRNLRNLRNRTTFGTFFVFKNGSSLRFSEIFKNYSQVTLAVTHGLSGYALLKDC